MRLRRAALIGAATLVLGVMAGCGGGDDTAATTPADANGITITVTDGSIEEAREEALERMRSEIDQQLEDALATTPGGIPAPPARTGTYPRKVPIGEAALPQWAIDSMQQGSPFPEQAIEWAPGIYTRAAEPIGDVEDYSTVYGPCPEAKRFIADKPLSLTCTT